MKPFAALLALMATVAAVPAADPLFVPQADYAYSQPVTPQLQPLPEPQFGVPSPSFGGTLGVPQGLPAPQAFPTPQIIESYPLNAGPIIGGPLVPLYPNVKIRSAHKKWPGGVSEVVQIPNPTPRSGCTDPVYVEICVPPGCQPVVTYGPRGQRVTYAFGGYRVQVTSLRGEVTIDYDRRG